jgi:hypothetical protein
MEDTPSFFFYSSISKGGLQSKKPINMCAAKAEKENAKKFVLLQKNT